MDLLLVTHKVNKMSSRNDMSSIYSRKVDESKPGFCSLEWQDAWQRISVGWFVFPDDIGGRWECAEERENIDLNCFLPGNIKG